MAHSRHLREAHPLKVLDVKDLHAGIGSQGVQYGVNVGWAHIRGDVLLQAQHTPICLKCARVGADQCAQPRHLLVLHAQDRPREQKSGHQPAFSDWGLRLGMTVARESPDSMASITAAYGTITRKTITLAGSMMPSQCSALSDTHNHGSDGDAGVLTWGHNSTEVTWVLHCWCHGHSSAGIDTPRDAQGSEHEAGQVGLPHLKWVAAWHALQPATCTGDRLIAGRSALRQSSPARGGLLCAGLQQSSIRRRPALLLGRCCTMACQTPWPVRKEPARGVSDEHRTAGHLGRHKQRHLPFWADLQAYWWLCLLDSFPGLWAAQSAQGWLPGQGLSWSCPAFGCIPCAMPQLPQGSPLPPRLAPAARMLPSPGLLRSRQMRSALQAYCWHANPWRADLSSTCLCSACSCPQLSCLEPCCSCLPGHGGLCPDFGDGRLMVSDMTRAGERQRLRLRRLLWHACTGCNQIL